MHRHEVRGTFSTKSRSLKMLSQIHSLCGAQVLCYLVTLSHWIICHFIDQLFKGSYLFINSASLVKLFTLSASLGTLRYLTKVRTQNITKDIPIGNAAHSRSIACVLKGFGSITSEKTCRHLSFLLFKNPCNTHVLINNAKPCVYLAWSRR